MRGELHLSAANNWAPNRALQPTPATSRLARLSLVRWASELTNVCRFAATTMVIAFPCSSSALACDCGSLDLSRRFANADLVVVAKVSSFKALDYVTVSPVEVFKGSASGTLMIQTGRSDCDFFLPPVNPKLGEEYLLYLHQSEGQLTANRCLASGPAAEKAMEVRELRQHFKPNPQPGAPGNAPPAARP